MTDNEAADTDRPIVELFIEGVPEAQARPRLGRHGRIYSPISGWRKLLRLKLIEARAGRHVRLDGGCVLHLHFYMPRPTWHRRADGSLRASAPASHVVRPDIDNMVKCVMDAMVDAGWLGHDAQVTGLCAWKRYADDRPGLLLKIFAIPC